MSIFNKIFSKAGRKAIDEVDNVALKAVREVQKAEKGVSKTMLRKAERKAKYEASKGFKPDELKNEFDEALKNYRKPVGHIYKSGSETQNINGLVDKPEKPFFIKQLNEFREKEAQKQKETIGNILFNSKETFNSTYNNDYLLNTTMKMHGSETGILERKMRDNRDAWERLKKSKKNFIVKDSTESDLKKFRSIGDEIIEGTNVTGNQFADLIENGGFQSEMYGIQSKDGSFIPLSRTTINPYAKEGELKRAKSYYPNSKPKMRKEIKEKPPKVKSDNDSIKDKVQGTQNFVYKMAAMGVGGGLVLNLANNKGQQTNNQLYGM